MEESKIEKKLSASAIANFLSCPLKYKFQFVDKIEAPVDSPHLIYGTALHKAIETFHKSIWSKNLISLDQMTNTFINSWELGIELNGIPVKWYKESSKNEMLIAGVDSVKNYYEVHKNDKAPPTFKFINVETNKPSEHPAVELYFTLDLGELAGRPDWVINGVIDLISMDGDDIIVTDHKTGSQKYNDFKVKTDLQLAIYSYAFRKICRNGGFVDFPADTKESYVMFDIISKKKPVIFYHKRKITEGTYAHLSYIIKGMISQIERAEFLPNYAAVCYEYGGCPFQNLCGDFKFQ